MGSSLSTCIWILPWLPYCQTLNSSEKSNRRVNTMKKVIVTGCAGFIGSALSKRLLTEGYDVLGVDCFTDNYDREIKEKLLSPLFQHKQFQFISKGILDVDWEP